MARWLRRLVPKRRHSHAHTNALNITQEAVAEARMHDFQTAAEAAPATIEWTKSYATSIPSSAA